MQTLQQLVPDVGVLLALAPEELAPYLLDVAKSQLQGGMINPTKLILVTAKDSLWDEHVGEIELAVAEAWNWLCVQGLLIPASGLSGTSGFCTLSRRGRAVTNKDDFKHLAEAAAFPKSRLHPSIADKVWLDLVRGDLADAVFSAFRTVEEAVRHVGGYAAADMGIELMRKAFNPRGGPLADMKQEKGQREALAHLFAGAIGSYKNPHSHRTVSITDPKEAQEIVLLASHLLRIVDARAALKAESN